MNNASQKKIRKQMQQEPLIMDFYKMVHKYDLQKEASEIFNRLNPPKDKTGKAIKPQAPEKTDRALTDDNPIVMVKGKMSVASEVSSKKAKTERPRQLVDASSLESRLEDLEKPQKRSVGRPRKVVAATPEVVSPVVEAPQKRKVGRPAKVQAQVVVEKPQSNRGRPLCLKVARKKLGYTQSEMAKFLGVSQGLVCQMEKKAVPISADIESKLRALKNK